MTVGEEVNDRERERAIEWKRERERERERTGRDKGRHTDRRHLIRVPGDMEMKDGRKQAEIQRY